MSRTMSWPYHAAATVLLLSFAVGSIERLPLLLLFAVFAILELVVTVRVFVRERSQYSLRNLLVTVTLGAVLMKLCLAFGMAMAVVVGVAAGGAVILLFALEWRKHGEERSEDAGKNA